MGPDAPTLHPVPAPTAPAAPTVTLLTRPGCHLCDDARSIVRDVVDRLAAEGRPIVLDERSILEDPALHDRWSDDVPVVLIDDRLHARWRVDADALAVALTV